MSFAFWFSKKFIKPQYIADSDRLYVEGGEDMPKDSTNALIMMTAQGDTAAFETLYRQMRKPV